jgi:hypothetical protein
MGEKRLEEACVKDERKTKKELIAELEAMRHQRAMEQAAVLVREAVLAMRSSADLIDVETRTQNRASTRTQNRATLS